MATPYKFNPNYQLDYSGNKYQVKSDNTNIVSQTVKNKKIQEDILKNKRLEAEQRKIEAENKGKNIILEMNNEMANPSIQTQIGEGLQKPLRYIANPLKAIGDVERVVTGTELFPNTNEDTLKSRMNTLQGNYNINEGLNLASEALAGDLLGLGLAKGIEKSLPYVYNGFSKIAGSKFVKQNLIDPTLRNINRGSFIVDEIKHSKLLNKNYDLLKTQRNDLLNMANKSQEEYYTDLDNIERLQNLADEYSKTSPHELTNPYQTIIDKIKDGPYEYSVRYPTSKDKIEYFKKGNYPFRKMSGYYDPNIKESVISPNLNPDEILYSTFHEGAHKLTYGNKYIPKEIKKDLPNLLEPQSSSKLDEKLYNYLSDPGEIQARMVELRKHYNLKGDDITNLTEEQSLNILNDIHQNKTPIDPGFTYIFKDVNSFKKLMQKMSVISTGISTLGVNKAYQYNQNNNN